jgi:hypothetical protein
VTVIARITQNGYEVSVKADRDALSDDEVLQILDDARAWIRYRKGLG